MFDTFTVITIIVTFLFAGTVKGVIGLGLAIISLGLLTMTIGLQEAMVIFGKQLLEGMLKRL